MLFFWFDHRFEVWWVIKPILWLKLENFNTLMQVSLCLKCGTTWKFESILEHLQRAQYVTPDSKIYYEKVKMSRFSSGTGIFCTKLVQLAVAEKGTTQLCTSKKECKKLDLTAAQYFWLVDHNDWSRWFAISSPHIYAVPVTLLSVGLGKKKRAKLRHLIYYPEWHTEHQISDYL